MAKGWFGNREKHRLASKGIRSSMLRRKGLMHRADDTWDYRHAFIENFGYYDEKDFEKWLIDNTGKAPFLSEREGLYIKNPSPISAHGKEKINEKNAINYIIQYETDGLSDADTLRLFSYLIKTGQAWTLQGHYGRTAKFMIDNGYIDKDGNIEWSGLYD